MMKFDLPKGFQDFSGDRARLRVHVIDTIRSVFERYNFEPLETPLMEPIEVLSAKFAAGEESDALNETYRLEDKSGKKFGLRFDLTVPLARFVSQNNRLPNPYKRYAIGSVFRDGGVDKNRYREFTQCDADIVGLGGPLYDAEIILLAMDGYNALGMKATVLINNKKLLLEMLDRESIPKEQQESTLISVDKLDKLPVAAIQSELEKNGLSTVQATAVVESFTSQDKSIESFLKKYPDSVGLREIQQVIKICAQQGVLVSFSPSLVRGLAYYTGMIVECRDQAGLINGSIGGGGRYDAMIGQYAGNNKIVPAVGFAFGIERIVDWIKARGEKNAQIAGLDYYVIPVGVEPETCLTILQTLRAKGYSAEMDFEKRSASKGLENANKKNARFAVIVGEEELMQRELTVKDLKTGKQEKNQLKDIPVKEQKSA